MGASLLALAKSIYYFYTVLEYFIQDGNLDACSVASIPRGVLGIRVNLDTSRVRVNSI